MWPRLPFFNPMSPQGVTVHASILTSRERDEGCTLPELPLLVQEVSRVESVGRLPLVLVKEHRGEVGNDGNPLMVVWEIVNE